MPAEKLQLVRSAYANETAEKKRTLYARSYHVWCKLSKLRTFEQPIKLFPIYRYIHALMQSLLSTVNVVIYGRHVSHGVTLVVKASDFSTEKASAPSRPLWKHIRVKTWSLYYNDNCTDGSLLTSPRHKSLTKTLPIGKGLRLQAGQREHQKQLVAELSLSQIKRNVLCEDRLRERQAPIATPKPRARTRCSPGHRASNRSIILNDN